jgi:hypothetical protein
MSVNTRTVEQWKQVLGRLPSPEGTPVEQVVANRVLGDLVGYRHGSRHRKRDFEELANAMTAWSEMNAESVVLARTYNEGREAKVQRHASDEFAREMAGDDETT